MVLARTSPLRSCAVLLAVLGALVCATLVALLAPRPAAAAVEPRVTASACDTTGWIVDWVGERPLALAPFDTTLGRLVSVDLSVQVRAGTSYALENTAATPAHVVVARGGSVMTTAPGAPSTSADTDARFSADLAVFDGVLDHAGVSGAAGALDATDATTLVHPTDLGPWTGSSLVPVTTTSAASTAVHADVGVDRTTATSTRTDVCVTYGYEVDVTTCVAGRVVEAGPAALRLEAVDAASGVQVAVTTTSADGAWRICGLEPDTDCVIRFALPADRALVVGEGSRALLAGDGQVRIPCRTVAGSDGPSLDATLRSTSSADPDPVSAPTVSAAVPARSLLVRVRASSPEVTARGVVTFTARVSNPTARVRRNVRVCQLTGPALVLGARGRAASQSSERRCWTIARLAPGAGRVLRTRMRALDVTSRHCTSSVVEVTVDVRSAPLGAAARTCVLPRV